MKWSLTLASAVLLLCPFAGPVKADVSECSVPPAPIPISEDPAAPTIDVIAVGVSEDIQDVDVTVNVSHDYIDDVILEITSPAGTTVRLHDQTGDVDDDFIIVPFDDQGLPYASVPFNIGCNMQPSGPGTLADFSGENTLGDWSLSALDTYTGGASGTLDTWCLDTFASTTSSPVLPVANLLCTSVGGTGVADLTWTNGGTYDSIDILIGGALVTTLPGTATSYSTDPQPFPATVEVCVEPHLGGQIPCLPICCTVPLQALPADLEVCSAPGLTVSNTLPPTVDVITVTEVQEIGDLQIQVDVTHPFIGDLNIDVAHTGTTLRLHDGLGGAADQIAVTFWDLGVPNGSVPYACGCLMQPSGLNGVGTLSDFFGLFTDGDWTLTVEDFYVGAANFGTLNSWCVRSFQSGSVTGLACSTSSGTGSIDATWTNTVPYDNINVYVNGGLEAVLPGTATSYTTLPQPIPSTVEVCIEPISGGTVFSQACCTIDVLVTPVESLDCSSVSGSGVADLTWANPVVYDSINVYVGGVLEVTLAGSATSHSTLPQAFPGTAAVCVEGIQGGAPAEQICCNVPLLDVVDIESCLATGAPFDSAQPLIEVITISNSIIMSDVEVMVDITHTFVGDLNIDLTSPAITTVRLHNEQGGADDDLVVHYTDSGIPNGGPFNCGCSMQPSGPGVMGDFAFELSDGDWILTVEDIYGPSLGGTLDRWCVRIVGGCQVQPPTGVTCSSTGTDVLVSWTNNDAYDSIDILRDGAVIDTLAGGMTSYSDTNAGPGVHFYEVVGNSAALACGNSSGGCSAGVGITDLIFDGDLGGDVDSVAALETALTGSNRVVMVVEELTAAAVTASGDPQILWVCLGTYPVDHQLTTTESDAMVSFLSAGNSVYLEGADNWGFNDLTSFADYDGVLGTLADGIIMAEDPIDTLTSMNGLAHGAADMSSFQAVLYTQDSGAGDDFTDHLLPTGSDPTYADDIPGNDAGIIWENNVDGVPPPPPPPPPPPAETAFGVGIFYNTSATFGNVLCQSWEFGGFGGDQATLVDLYVTALTPSPPPPGQFIRGDVNTDGLFNIADPVSLLSELFVPGTPPGPCADSGDVNDDGLKNIADAVSALSSLFVPGAPPPPAPHPSCGPDPSADTLDCQSFPPCP